MRRFLSALVLASVLGSAFTSFPAAYAQRSAEKSKKAAASVAAQRGVDTISASQMKDYLTFIASDEMEGRDTPSRGLDTTAKFLALNLSRWGFKPAGDNGTFFQRIDLNRQRPDGGQTKVEYNSRTLTLGTDYLPGGQGNVSGQLVYAGSGWLVKSKEIDAYKDVDPKGRIAVIFGSPNMPPRGVTRADLRAAGQDAMNPVEYARSKGVVGLIFVADYQYLANWQNNRQRITERPATVVAKFQRQAPATLPSIIISPETANSLMVGEKQTGSQIFNTLNDGGALPPSFLMRDEKKVTLNVAATTETVPTQNVVAVWEGSDPVLKAEYVALGAHYDHVGTGCRPTPEDRICNGADDDGSGTTAMLSMAEALAKAPVRPKRSILFVWHCGEEKGLWGSRYFTEYPTVPLNAIVAQLNMDMIGRSKKPGDTNARNNSLTGPDAVYLIGSTMMSTELGELVNSVNKSYLNLTFDTKYDDPKDPNRFFYRSDHYSYARKGIPIIFFFDGEHEDYHGVGDTADKIDYEKMQKIARTVYMTAWEIANRPARLKVDKPLPAQVTISVN
ncbi:MAG TPA: M20/M25/M40 family metallo-hydrolase [Pyrinomonadaceae bacterium]|nr:M20/M25/M40 family metallo-hydrolase [Pyrinomonadaceae bacterium]